MSKVTCPACGAKPRGDLMRHIRHCAGVKTGYQKFRAIPTVVNGKRFASIKEAKRFHELLALEKAGEIRDLACQVCYHLFTWALPQAKWHERIHVCDYVADFFYITKAGDTVVEDVKGVQTPLFKLKRKLFEANYGLKIVLV